MYCMIFVIPNKKSTGLKIRTSRCLISEGKKVFPLLRKIFCHSCAADRIKGVLLRLWSAEDKLYGL